MIKNFTSLLCEIGDSNGWKPMRFGLYNKVDDEYYPHRLEKLGYDSSIDDLEYKPLDLGDASDCKGFKNYVEDTVQKNNTVICIAVYNEKSVVYAVKPKAYDAAKFIEAVRELSL